MLAVQHTALQGCACHHVQSQLGDAPSKKAAWIGAIGLGLSAALMVALGFHKPAPRRSRRRRT